MELRRLRYLLATLAMLVSAGISTAQATTSRTPTESVYYLTHSSSDPLNAEEQVERVAFYHASVLPVSRGGGREVIVRPLWVKHMDAAGQSRLMMDLDPADPDDTASVKILTRGFSTTVPSGGPPPPLRALDQTAWKQLERSSAAAARTLVATYQAPGIHPLPVTPSIKAGDVLTGWQRIEPYSSVETKMKVVEVTPDAVLMEVAIEDAAAQGEGRMVVQRTDGMPIELRLEIRYRPTKAQPASVHRLHLADIEHDPMLAMTDDPQEYTSYVEQIEGTLGRPPFSAPSDDAAAYTHRPVVLGELEDYMVGADVLPGLESFMGAFWIPSDEGRRRLTLGARLIVPARPGRTEASRQEAVLMSRLRGVQLLDESGSPVHGLDAVPVTRTLFVADRYSVGQDEAGFPFHLPLDTPDDALDRIAAVRMDVDAEVYDYESVETLAIGQQSAINNDLQVRVVSPQRVTVLHGRQSWKEKTGVYSVVEALDAQGNVLPSERVLVAPLAPASPTRLVEVPLAWENGRIPLCTEIASSRPITGLQIRHYRWRSVPRSWTFPVRQ